MSRPKEPAEKRKSEGAALAAMFHQAQKIDPSLTQESLASDMGVSQGLVAQWFSGRTLIPDRRLLALAERLAFDPAGVRPDITDLYRPQESKARTRLEQAIRQIRSEDEDYVASVIEALTKAKR